MTDARFPDRWLSDRRIARLSDAHFRSFVTSLAWSVTNRTDGVVEPEDLALIPNFAADSVKTFIGARLWIPRQAAGRGWEIVDFQATQTTSAELRSLDEKRAKERAKKAAQRAAAKADSDSSTSTNAAVPRDVPRDVPTDCTGKATQGKDMQGESEALVLASGADWPEWGGVGPDPFDEYR